VTDIGLTVVVQVIDTTLTQSDLRIYGTGYTSLHRTWDVSKGQAALK